MTAFGRTPQGLSDRILMLLGEKDDKPPPGVNRHAPCRAKALTFDHWMLSSPRDVRWLRKEQTSNIGCLRSASGPETDLGLQF